jgi:NADH-quinone oxidoreductase subunit C
MAEEAAVAEAPPPTGPVFGLFQQALPGVSLEGAQTPIDTAITVRRDDFASVMDAARNDERLAFDYLRCLSGVDWIEDLEVVYHLWSFKHSHGVALKVRFPAGDAHVPTVSHIWQTANWHERETQEMYGIVFDGHPDPRPLLTEEGLGYYPLLKSHPLADIEDWQEDYLQAIEDAKAQLAEATGVAPVLDEKALKIKMAQEKAQVMKKARDEARAQGLSPEDEKAAVQAAIKQFEEEFTARMAGGGAAAPAAAPVDPRAAKIQLAQAKAGVIKKARDEARAKGMSAEDERAYVAEALKTFSEQQAAAPAPVAAPAAAPAAPQTPADARAAKIQLAQAKAAVITKAREEARAKGMSPEDERAFVAEALKNFSEQQG